MPDGRVSWAAYEGEHVVAEVHEFIVHLEALRFAPNTIRHYAWHIVRLGNFLANSGKTFTAPMPMEFDRFVTLVGRHLRLQTPTIRRVPAT